MSYRLCALVVATLVCAVVTIPMIVGRVGGFQRLHADEQNDAQPTAPPETQTAKREPLKIERTVKGVFEAAEMTKIFITPEVWTDFEVVEAVAHGAEVAQGETLVTFDVEKIDETIQQLATELERSGLDLQQKELEFQILQETVPLDLAASERSKNESHENLEHFRQIARPLGKKNAEFLVKVRQDYLEYQKEELRQLERMYAEDDLTEETEEIILRRQRDTVERARHSVEQAKIDRDSRIKIDLRRQSTNLEVAAHRQALAWTKAKTVLPMNLKKQELELAKARHEREKSNERLAHLQADRELMVVRAAVDGVVYYGQFVRGKWSRGEAMTEKLRQGGRIQPREVFMTLVVTQPMFVRAEVEEKDLADIRAGMPATLIPTGYEKKKLSGRVEEVSRIPLRPGSFEANVKISSDLKDETIVPGMTCTIKLVPYFNQDALTVATSALVTDPQDDEKYYVNVLKSDGQVEKRLVTVGRDDGKKTEILEGLNEGDKVLMEKPSE